MSIIDKEEKIMQRTTNYGLCQYEGSDKTSYLVNYNDDMLKIDTAIKNAADAGSGAGTAAERAQSTADGAARDVSTLNTQINGANGLAADVSTLQGSVGSINSLIGDGHPTTSNQTIIGAVNGLEGALAPREDGINLANNYAIGEQFARGGSLFTALTSLTAGTPFASLVLNTNYKVSDTIAEQIAAIDTGLSPLNRFKNFTVSYETTDTLGAVLTSVLNELNTRLAALTANHGIKNVMIDLGGVNGFSEPFPIPHWHGGTINGMQLFAAGISANDTQYYTAWVDNGSGLNSRLQKVSIATADNAVTLTVLNTKTASEASLGTVRCYYEEF